MGFDNIIENNKEWKSSTNYILIKNNICKTMKEINDSLNKHIDEKKKNNKPLFENFQKNNVDYKKSEEYKKKQIEEQNKNKTNKPKFNNNNYNLLLNFSQKKLSVILSNITKFKNIFKNKKNYKKLQKIENMLICY